MDNSKFWFEGKTGYNNACKYGMSSGNGCTIADLPLDINAGSVAFDYTTKKLYTFDGKSWN